MAPLQISDHVVGVIVANIVIVAVLDLDGLAEGAVGNNRTAATVCGFRLRWLKWGFLDSEI